MFYRRGGGLADAQGRPVQLTFEGDHLLAVIISKALLLADDPYARLGESSYEYERAMRACGGRRT